MPCAAPPITWPSTTSRVDQRAAILDDHIVQQLRRARSPGRPPPGRRGRRRRRCRCRAKACSRQWPPAPPGRHPPGDAAACGTRAGRLSATLTWPARPVRHARPASVICSAGWHCSRWAAMRRMRPARMSDAAATAPPAMTMQREPQVPVEYGRQCRVAVDHAHAGRVDAQDLAARAAPAWFPAPGHGFARRRAVPIRHPVSAAPSPARSPAPSGYPSRHTPWCRAPPARKRWTGRRRCGRPSASPASCRARMAGQADRRPRRAAAPRGSRRCRSISR